MEGKKSFFYIGIVTGDDFSRQMESAIEMVVLSDRILQIFIELPKFASDEIEIGANGSFGKNIDTEYEKTPLEWVARPRIYIL